MRRAVITGLGVISPLGCTVHEFWSNLTAGRSGIAPITHFDASSFPVRIAGEVKSFHPKPAVSDGVGLRDRKILLALAAAEQAITNSRLSPTDLENAAITLGVGLEILHLEDLTPYANNLSKFTLQRAQGGGHPLQTPLDTTAELLGTHYGFYAGRYTNCSACAAGTQAVGEAYQLITENLTDIVLAGATDSMLNPLGLGGFSLLRVLSDENETPTRACRPFDITRKGTVLGEGAAFLIIESLDHALARNAHIYAEILSYATSLDAFRVSDPDPDAKGAITCMTRAIANANLQPTDIHCINAHATGTPKNDIVETAAIKQVLGQHAYKIPVHAVKSMTGHMIAASGALEAVAATLTLHHRIVPPTINLLKPDPLCDLDYVPHNGEGSRQFTGNTVLSNSFGFGGQNATLIFSKYRK